MSVKICCGARWDSRIGNCPECGKELIVDEVKSNSLGSVQRGGVMALSLWQPWASLIAKGAKTIETRSWSTNYRGKLAIHAGKNTKALHEDFYMGTNLFINFGDALGISPEQMLEELPLGGVVALVDLVDVLPAQEALKKYRDQEPFGDFSEGRFAWILENIRPILPAVEMSGQQKLFRVDLEGLTQ